MDHCRWITRHAAFFVGAYFHSHRKHTGAGLYDESATIALPHVFGDILFNQIEIRIPLAAVRGHPEIL
jgi:hypothetical protein